ncbi:MAG: 1-deoxy-D-xylulose-5-phosphate reductoisomerase [Turicibacter sp.]|nr:1-deoxy-D-xylulose-5-phosphate reductoisomerase [Turicibacter sp.]
MDISILGATGSIGLQAINVAKSLGIRVKAIAGGTDFQKMIPLIISLKPDLAAMYNEQAALSLREFASNSPNFPKTKIVAGMDGLLDCAVTADLLLNAVVGSVGLKPTLAALTAKKEVALANKETLVAAGSLVMETARQNGVQIRPIDSEHSAIWQCLAGAEKESVDSLILTASGGAFRNKNKAEIALLKAKDALKHPNWDMGAKITIDCATMVNKGLEYIEAHWLFDMPYERIKIVIHPQSIVHSMVQFKDGATLAQLGNPDMEQPIQYALTYPDRLPRATKPLDFCEIGELNFTAPDFDRFPALDLVIKAAKTGGTMPAIVNKVNELLVAQFLRGKIGFYDISGYLAEAIAKHSVMPITSIENVIAAEEWATEWVKGLAI